MKLRKMIAAGLCAAAVSGMAFAQSKTETTVEDEYLSNVEDVIITELATSPEYENKLLALQYLENAIGEGRTSPDTVAALQSLAGEGVTTISRKKGRKVNNFPDVRRKACELLGSVKDEKAVKTLTDVARDDMEPSVVAAAIHSLGEIGINTNGDVVNQIYFVERKYAVTNPTSSLALEILFAYEKLADSTEDKSLMVESITNIAVNYKYKTPVREKAKELLKTLQGSGSGSSSGKEEDAGR